MKGFVIVVCVALGVAALCGAASADTAADMAALTSLVEAHEAGRSQPISNADVDKILDRYGCEPLTHLRACMFSRPPLFCFR